MNNLRLHLSFLILSLLQIVQMGAATVSVNMTQSDTFSPATVTIKQGDTVTWVAVISGHDTTSNDGLWASGTLSRGQTFSFTFNTVGTFKYFCTPHASRGMRGTVIVTAAANTPPIVSITQPADGTTFSATDTIVFSANASDDGSIASVEFFANDNSIGSATAAPFSLSTTLLAGSYSVTAKATDNLGASSTSAPVNITVQAAAENQLPTVSLSSDQTLIAAGATLGLKAAATDPDGNVVRVEFFNGKISIGTDTSSPFELSLPNLPAGRYLLSATATDNSNGKTTSSPPLEIRIAAQPKIESVTHDQTGSTIHFSGTSEIVHTLEASSNFSTWATVGTVTPTNGAAILVDPAKQPIRFYRVVVK